MAKRRGSRKLALDVLYESEISGIPSTEILGRYAGNPAYKYTAFLVDGVDENKERIDEIITEYAKDWALDRMPPIDLNLLRISIFELLFCPDIPAGVAMNEAVELAGIYSTDDSGRFINGVLAQIDRQSGKDRAV